MAIDAEEVQARLALRSMWTPAKQAMTGTQAANGTNGTASHEEAGYVSPMHRKLRSEVDDVLKSGLLRRLARLERQVKVLCDSNGLIGADAKGDNGSALTPAAAAEPDSTAADEDDEPSEAERRLCESVATALRRANRCTQVTVKNYGPTPAQAKLPDPPEKDEGLVRESSALRASLSSTSQSLGSRARQLKNLAGQLVVCEKELSVVTAQANDAIEQFTALKKDPSQLVKLAEEWVLKKQRARVREMRENAIRQREQAKYYQALAHQQRAFFLQSERVAASGGREVISRHPAGEVFFVPQPPSLDDDNTQEIFDVGTAVANPYVCDSWPFEPNVLARKGPQEGSMPPFTEETEEDLEEENRRFRNPFRPNLNLRLPARGGSDDEDDDYNGRYNGPSDTARSL